MAGRDGMEEKAAVPGGLGGKSRVGTVCRGRWAMVVVGQPMGNQGSSRLEAGWKPTWPMVRPAMHPNKRPTS